MKVLSERGRGIALMLVLCLSMAAPLGFTGVASAEETAVDEALEAEGLNPKIQR